MKKLLWIATVLPLLSMADEYIVPDINMVEKNHTPSKTTDPLPLFSTDIPLSERDFVALKFSNQWLQGERYPYQESDRVVYLYGAGQPTLVCAPLELCVIYLEAGERVVENGVHLGDTVRWQIAPAIGAEHRTQLVVKPIDVGLETSLVIITNRRTYHIKLRSRRHDYMPGIAFKYPSDLATQWQEYHQKTKQIQEHSTTSQGINLADLDFNYRIEGCADCYFKPLRVYNDGAQTIIEMPHTLKRGTAPALLVNGSQGDELVNYRVQESKYIVDRLFMHAILINGVGKQQQKVTIDWTGGK